MSNLIDSLQNWLVKRLPLARRTVSRSVQTFGYQFVSAPNLDVDTVHAILSSADDGDPRQLFDMYEQIILSDAHLQCELNKRKLAVLGDPWAVTPADPKNTDDLAAADVIRRQITQCSSFMDACSHILESCLYPVGVLEKVYKPSTVPGLRYELDQLVPVPWRLLNYVQDRRLRICDTDPQWGEVLATTHTCDPMRYIVHRAHLLTAEDHRGGPMRALVFWWLFSFFDRDWWVRYLDRYGAPFLVGKYDQSDDASRSILINAFQSAARISGVVISKETDVEIKEAMSKSSGEAYEAFHTIANREKSKLIVGQTTSAEAQAAGGINSGVGESQAAVRSDIRQFDALRMADTFQHQLFAPLLEINGLSGNVIIGWGAEEVEDTQKTSTALANLANAGIEVSDDGLSTLSQRFGVPLRRKVVSVSPPAVATFDAPSPQSIKSTTGRSALAERGDKANGKIASVAAADVSQAFRGALAPVRQILIESSSPDDFERRLNLYFADWHPDRIASIVEIALQTHFANGLVAVTPKV
jgi:phage gp29-like protein